MHGEVRNPFNHSTCYTSISGNQKMSIIDRPGSGPALGYAFPHRSTCSLRIMNEPKLRDEAIIKIPI